MATRMISDEIAKTFAQRLPASGGWISVKQCAWLLSVSQDEIKRQGLQPDAYQTGGKFQADNGDTICWTLYRAPNHAGNLTFSRMKTMAEYVTEWETQAAEYRIAISRKREINVPEEFFAESVKQLAYLEARIAAQV